MKSSAFFLLICLVVSAAAQALDVRITEDLEYVDVIHNGKPVRIMRNQDPENVISSRYSLTSRKCPPFCIQPNVIAEGVETIAELEMLSYLQQASQPDPGVLVIDSRTPDWVSNGTIPGSINIPWTTLDTGAGADPFEISDIMQGKFGVHLREGLWDFTSAKTLVLFCNGNWCGQSSCSGGTGRLNGD